MRSLLELASALARLRSPTRSDTAVTLRFTDSVLDHRDPTKRGTCYEVLTHSKCEQAMSHGRNSEHRPNLRLFGHGRIQVTGSFNPSDRDGWILPPTDEKCEAD